MKASRSAEDRYKKEMAFHDHAFSDDQIRAPAGKYYSVTSNQKDHYYGWLQKNTARGMTVLEYGCGPHTASGVTARLCDKVVGIDLSPFAIKRYVTRAKERGIGIVTGCVMNAEHLGFPNETFDIIYGSSILHHLDLDRSLVEISRSLKPGGKAIFIEPLGHNPFINLYRALTPALRTPDEHPLKMRDFEILRKYFGRVDATYFNMSSLMAVPLRRLPLFRKCLNLLNAIDRTLFNSLPFLRRYAWSTVIIMEAPIKVRRPV